MRQPDAECVGLSPWRVQPIGDGSCPENSRARVAPCGSDSHTLRDALLGVPNSPPCGTVPPRRTGVFIMRRQRWRHAMSNAKKARPVNKLPDYDPTVSRVVEVEVDDEVFEVDLMDMTDPSEEMERAAEQLKVAPGLAVRQMLRCMGIDPAGWRQSKCMKVFGAIEDKAELTLGESSGSES